MTNFSLPDAIKKRAKAYANAGDVPVPRSSEETKALIEQVFEQAATEGLDLAIRLLIRSKIETENEMTLTVKGKL